MRITKKIAQQVKKLNYPDLLEVSQEDYKELRKALNNSGYQVTKFSDKGIENTYVLGIAVTPCQKPPLNIGTL